MTPAGRAAETAARESYGRLVAYLSRRTRNIATAEDALAEAFAAALATWPLRGVPEKPEAWLLTAARRKIADERRRESVKERLEPDIADALVEAEDAANRREMADERLKLLFICAHPAIDPDIRTPLMLQTVLGLDAPRIAAAFLTAPAAMAQRLVRAKRKIAAAKIPFETPEARELPMRAASVIEAVYAAFGASYDDRHGDSGDAGRLADEALFLARLAAALLPDEAEAHGLVALISHVHARRRARDAGGYAPFDDQDTSLWDRTLIDEAEAALARAASLKRPGRCQIEAAIQSAHVARRLCGADTRADVVKLYDALLKVAPSLGAEIGRAAALLHAGAPAAALAVLQAIDKDRVKTHQPYWATRAAAEQACGDVAAADAAYGRAIGLSSDTAVRRFLLERRAALTGKP